FLFGKDEAMQSIKGKEPSSVLNCLVNTNVQVREGLLDNAVSNIVPQCNKIQHPLRETVCSSIKHASCPHSSNCLYYCFQGFLRPFLTGYLISSGFRCLLDGKQLLINPSLVLDLMIEKKSLNLGLFLGGFGGTYRIINCLLRWLFEKDQAIYALPAAFLGGIFMKFYPSTSLSLYLMWKLIQYPSSVRDSTPSVNYVMFVTVVRAKLCFGCVSRKMEQRNLEQAVPLN
ncbi:transmembrane protein 135, partial [Trichonephila clavipes]